MNWLRVKQSYVLIAHQGDTTDYDSLVSLKEHSELLSDLLGIKVDFIEDIAGPTAVERINSLQNGEILLLENLRYLTEEVSTFEDNVRLSPEQMQNVYLVRRLARLFDCYVNEAFSAAHRSSPSMVAFQECLPSYGGRLFMKELNALATITENSERPCIYMLGGSRIGDAFGMIKKALSSGASDLILTSGLVGEVFMLGAGVVLGEPSERLIKEKGYVKYVQDAQELLTQYGANILYPLDVAFDKEGERKECKVSDLPTENFIFDIGSETIAQYSNFISKAKTIFVNGPVGIYENEISSKGTLQLWKAIQIAPGYTVVGGGDTVRSFSRYTDLTKINYVSTAGGALIRFLSGSELPLIRAMTKAKRGVVVE